MASSSRNLDDLLDEALDSFEDGPLSNNRDPDEAYGAATTSQQPAAKSAPASAPTAGKSQLAFDPLGRPPGRRPRARSAGAGGSGTSSVYSTARSRDLPPQPAETPGQTRGQQGGIGGAHAGGADGWEGLPVPPDVADLSDEEIATMMGSLLEQLGQVAAGDPGAAVPPRSAPSPAAASDQLDYSAMLRGLAERTPGAERVTGAAAEPSGGTDPAAEFSALLRGLAEQTVGGGQGSGSLAADDEQVLQALAASMRGMGLGEDDAQGANPDGMVNSIMRQLLSKDVLHQSMKDIGAKYPEWLEAHKDSISPEDLARYRQQLQHIEDICALYEHEPDNYDAIFNKMQEMQACGSPPEDIVKELSPDFDSGGAGSGMPRLPGVPSCSVM